MKQATIEAALDALRSQRQRVDEWGYQWGDDVQQQMYARIDAAIAELEAWGWEIVEEGYWGYFNVEREGTVVTIHLGEHLEVDKGYAVVPLPDTVRVYHRKPVAEGEVQP